MLKEILNDIEKKLEKSIEALKIDFSKISINKVNVNLLNDIKIKYYNDNYTLKQLSIMTLEGVNSITIKPFDKKNITAISKAIVDLNLDLNPFVNGDTIKVVFPKMTQERRETFTKKINNSQKKEK